MVFHRTLFLFCLIILASGCTAITIRPVDTQLQIKQVCIKDCQKECFDEQMVDTIRDGFKRHGITTTVNSDESDSQCEYHLSYYCERTWDMAMYMNHAELRLYQGEAQIGYAEYHLRGKGGFSLMKFKSTKEKIDPVIDQLLSGYTLR